MILKRLHAKFLTLTLLWSFYRPVRWGSQRCRYILIPKSRSHWRYCNSLAASVARNQHQMNGILYLILGLTSLSGVEAGSVAEPQKSPFVKRVVTFHGTVNIFCCTILGYQSSWVPSGSHHFNDDVASQIAKSWGVLSFQQESQMFQSSDKLHILSFLPAFKQEYNTKGFHQGASMCHFHLSKKKPARVRLAPAQDYPVYSEHFRRGSWHFAGKS